jgi:hypothetical protein
MKSWKTTLLGAAGAIYVAVSPIVATGVISWVAIAKAAGIALFGYFAKDFDTAGNPNA